VSNNTFVGKYAGYGATSGFSNSFFGAYSGGGTTGYNNTFVGYSAGSGVTTGTNNTMIGSFAGGLSGPYGSQNIYVGANINPPLNESNAIRIGVSGRKMQLTLRAFTVAAPPAECPYSWTRVGTSGLVEEP